MAVYYIATTGNDTTGDGSAGTPWATFTKALATVAAGDTVNVADGTYSENTASTGYLRIRSPFASWVTIQAANGAAGDVTVRAASVAVHNVLIDATTSYLRFRYIKFGVLTGTRSNIRFNAQATNVEFLNCSFINTVSNYPAVYYATTTNLGITFTDCVISMTGTATYLVQVQPSGGATCAVALNNCTCTTAAGSAVWVGGVGTVTINGGSYYTASGAYAPLYVTSGGTLIVSNATVTSAAAGGGIRSDNASNVVTLTNVTVYQNSAADGLRLNGGTVTVTNCIAFQAGAGKAVSFGLDDSTGGTATTVTCVGLYAAKTAGASSHVAIIGNGATGSFNGLTVVAASTAVADHALVIKECANVTLKNSRLNGGSSSALFLKAATSATVTANILIGVGTGGTLTVNAGDTGHTSANCTLTQNRIEALGAGNLLNWTTAGDGGGNVSNAHRYKISGPGKFGTVLGTTNIASLPALRAAWAGYGQPTNDSTSSVITLGGGAPFSRFSGGYNRVGSNGL